MIFHFAWVDPGQTSFSSGFAREDEQVLSFELSQEEGDFASLRLEVRNPRVGLLSIGRKQLVFNRRLLSLLLGLCTFNRIA